MVPWRAKIYENLLEGGSLWVFAASMSDHSARIPQLHLMPHGRRSSSACGAPTSRFMLLWLSIVVTITAFHPVNAAAAWLLLPYLAWVTFAAVLNFTVWRMNPRTVTAA